MSYPRHALSGAKPGPVSTQWTVRRRNVPVVENRPTRRFVVQWLDQSGAVEDLSRIAPAIPLFEQVFSAFGRGTLIPTIDGPVAVEDLMPGALVETSTGLSPLMWVGSMSIVPGSPAQDYSPLGLYRVTADSFGLDRPMPDLLLGPGARILSTRGALRDEYGTDAVLEPIAALADGMNVIEVRPISTVQTYHLGFKSHRTFSANGVEVESMHPGAVNQNRIDPQMMSLFLSMFPHIRQLSDFGSLCHPRLSTDAQKVYAA